MLSRERHQRLRSGLDAAILRHEQHDLLLAHPGISRRVLLAVMAAVTEEPSATAEEIASAVRCSRGQVLAACRYCEKIGALRRQQDGRAVRWDSLLSLAAPQGSPPHPTPTGLGAEVCDAAKRSGLDGVALEVLRCLATFCDDAGVITIGHGRIAILSGQHTDSGIARRMQRLQALGWVRLLKPATGGTPRTYALQRGDVK
jgi:hypothetical protein